MNNKQFHFIKKVSNYISCLSQFSVDVCYWIGCQFALESSFGESRLAIVKHNYCGMKNPINRISTAIHAGDRFYDWAEYADILFCVYDYLLCVQYHKPISMNYDSIKHFSSFISKFYCPEKDYIDKINLIYKQFKSYQNEK